MKSMIVRAPLLVAVAALSAHGLACGSDSGGPSPAGTGASVGTGSAGAGGSPAGGPGSGGMAQGATGPGSGGTSSIGGGGSSGSAGAGAAPVAGGSGAPGGGTAGGGGASSGGAGANGGTAGAAAGAGGTAGSAVPTSPREKIPFNDDWRFTQGDPQGVGTSLAYTNTRAWVLPTGNSFLDDPAERATRPAGNLGDGVTYLAPDFADDAWQQVDLPHDYAIEGPYSDGISGTMGHLPSTGVAWYRKTFTLAAEDATKSIFLDLDGAMSYSMVWVNGQFVGGWPYGYASYRVALTDHVVPGGENLIAIRLDNPTPPGSAWDDGSSRWYPGAGIYRNVWLVKTAPVHVGQWGTHVTTPQVSASAAEVALEVSVDNDSAENATVTLSTLLYELDQAGNASAAPAATLSPVELVVAAGSTATSTLGGTLQNPRLWGVPPAQQPNRYVAITTVEQAGTIVDAYETPFGVRTLGFDPDQGFLLNGEHVKLNGVCNHHDLGALGAAFNTRAEQRRFEILAEMGANAVRTAHNPPAPELLDIADRMGFLVMNEAFDVWATQKAAQDHHLFFPEWHEQDLRALVRRDRNHPSVILWSIGNEVVEQSDASAGPALGAELTAISHEEDPTRQTVVGMNSANADSPFPEPIDAVGLNYQGSGVRDGAPEYPLFHAAFPDKFIVGTETVDVYSSRGVYTFPVNPSNDGEPVQDSSGADNTNQQVSSYDLYHADWSYTPDREFRSQDEYPYVSGEFVWTGFDYLGEPTPYDSSRSSYSGILDLAGFKKDRFYLYQARWRPDLPMAHILPHWTWPDRAGQVTPVHVYTSGDEAELFLNDVSQGRKQKAQYEYRLRWDDVVYAPGELRVVAYKDSQEWATDSVQTAGTASGLELQADRTTIAADGRDLSFVTLTIVDGDGRLVPRSMNLISFSVAGSGEIIATDNGDPTDRRVFSATERDAFNGMALAIVRALPGQSSEIVVTAAADGLAEASVVVTAQ